MRDSSFALREGIRNFRRERTLSFAMAGSLAIAVFALGAMALTVMNVNYLLKEWESKVELVAFFKHDVSAEQSAAALERIHAFPQVREVRLVSGQESWVNLFAETGQPVDLGQLALDEILPPTAVIKLHRGNHELAKVRQLSAQIALLEEVDEVKFEEMLLERYFRFRREMTSFAAAAYVFWLFIFGIISANIARLAATNRANETQTMHLLGANRRLMREIFAVESLLQGTVGSLLGVSLLAGAAILLSAQLGRPLHFSIPAAAGVFVVGPLLAVLAGWSVFRRTFAVVVLGFCLALSASGPMYADDLDDEVAKYREELGKLRGELEQNKAAAKNIAARERTLSLELEKMEKEIDALEQDVKSANHKKETNKSAITEGQSQLAQYKQELADARRELEQWLKMLSVRRMPSVAEVVFFDIPHSDITLRHHIVSLLAQKEAEASERTEALGSRYDRQQDDLRKRSELDSLYVETTNLRVRQLLEKKQQREQLLAELRAQKTIYAAAINDLEASSKNLQDLLDSTPPKTGNQLAAPAPFGEMKGLLPWPAQGEVAVPFGRIQNLDSPTYTRHLGIDISAPANSEICVVHDGVVAYCDWFRGYGKLVIVDHGEGYNSIYSHCSEILVKKGDSIRAGTPLALVGETGSLKGPFLYFEIREKGQPVDPLVWLQRRM